MNYNTIDQILMRKVLEAVDGDGAIHGLSEKMQCRLVRIEKDALHLIHNPCEAAIRLDTLLRKL